MPFSDNAPATWPQCTIVAAALVCLILSSAALMQSTNEIATSKFQFSLPYALQSLSPALAALHTTRARLLNHPNLPGDTFTTTHCSRCGTYLLDGESSVRIIRKTGGVHGKINGRAAASYTRILRRSCNVCKHEEDVPIDNGNAGLFPKVRRRKAGEKSIDSIPREPLPQVPQSKNPLESLPDSRKDSSMSSRAPSVVSAHPPRISTPTPTPPTRSPVPQSGHLSSSRAKPRPKKKSGLQDMLARNRERQEQERKATGSVGLAAFLENLQ